MSAEVQELAANVRDLERDVTVLKITVANSLATREWVKDLVDPIKENTAETRRFVEEQRRDFSAYMQQRAEIDKKESDARIEALKAQTWSAILKDKWAPIAAFIVALSILVNVTGALLAAFMASHGFPVK